jgi:hypothetical protein
MTHPPTVEFRGPAAGERIIIDLLLQLGMSSGLVALIPPNAIKALADRLGRGEFTERTIGQIDGKPVDMVNVERFGPALCRLIDLAERRVAP